MSIDNQVTSARPRFDVAGKAAVVTGGGKGVGRGISRALAASGARVCIGYNSNEALARQTLADIRAEGGEAFLFKADVADPDACREMAERAAREYGGIDVLVNNAALQRNLDITEYSEPEYDEMMRVNLIGYVYMMQACLPHLKLRQGASIVNISSVHGKRPTGFDPVYAMTKAGICMLTREAAIEFARYGIRVNALLPAAVKIEFKTGNPSFLGGNKRAHIQRDKHFNMYPLGRVGLPSDLGAMCVFLASEDAAFISGSGIRMDGCAMLL